MGLRSSTDRGLHLRVTLRPLASASCVPVVAAGPPQLAVLQRHWGQVQAPMEQNAHSARIQLSNPMGAGGTLEASRTGIKLGTILWTRAPITRARMRPRMALVAIARLL